MTPDELLERAADRIMQSEEWSSFFHRDDALAFSRAVLRLALEEAAKVARHLVVDTNGISRADCPEDAGAMVAADQISAAILSLIPGDAP
jgi:hypothetical protein